MESMTRAERREHWSGILEQWRESGLGKSAFCRQQDIPPWQFHYWFKRLEEQAQEPAEGFARVHASSGMAGSGIRLRLASGLEIDLDPGFDEKTLLRFLRVASGAC